MDDKTPLELNIQELDSQANISTLRAQQIMFAGFTVVWLLTMLGIFIVDRKLMTTVYVIGSAITLAPTIVCHWAGTDRGWIKYMVLLCSFASVTVINCVLTFHAVLLFAMPLLYAAQYTSRRVTTVMYIATVISVSVSVMVGYFFGICDANMLLLSNHPTGYYADMDAKILNLDRMSMNQSPWITLPVFFILPRCLILAVFVPVVRTISGNIIKSASTEARLRFIGETDKATRFYNRSKYMEMVPGYYQSMERVAVIFWDINGLKAINDTYGHAYGDSVIASAANCIYELSGERRKVFRLGGDEFLMLLEEDEADGLDGLLERWRELMAQAKRVNALPVSVAVGSAVGAGRDVRCLVDQADKAMYRDKERIKREEGRRI